MQSWPTRWQNLNLISIKKKLLVFKGYMLFMTYSHLPKEFGITFILLTIGVEKISSPSVILRKLKYRLYNAF